jgi:hypothetical protein
MSGSTGGEKPLSSLPVVAVTTGLRVLGFTSIGQPRAIDPAAFAAAPGGDVSLSSAAPLAPAPTGQPGISTTASRADHRHPFPTTTDIGAAPVVHTHNVADVNGLQGALDAKAPLAHTHNISGVNGLQSALDGKANIAHSHAIADVTGLQTALDGKLGIASRGALGGVAPLDAAGKVPLANLPATSTGVSNVNNGTLDGQIPVWNNTTAKYDATTPVADTSKKILTVQRNSPTVVDFTGYNNRRIVLTGNAPLSVAASEAGQVGAQSFVFMVKNRFNAINTITFGAGVVVDQYPVGTGTAGAVKIAAFGSVTVDMYPGENSTLIAEVRGQIA